MSDLVSITARLNAATQGPWHWDDDRWLMTGNYGVVVGVTGPLQGPGEADSVNIGTADAEFIAHAPEDIRYLLERVGELEAQRDAVLKLVAECDLETDEPLQASLADDIGTALGGTT